MISQISFAKLTKLFLVTMTTISAIFHPVFYSSRLGSYTSMVSNLICPAKFCIPETLWMFEMTSSKIVLSETQAYEWYKVLMTIKRSLMKCLVMDSLTEENDKTVSKMVLVNRRAIVRKTSTSLVSSFVWFWWIFLPWDIFLRGLSWLSSIINFCRQYRSK